MPDAAAPVPVPRSPAFALAAVPRHWLDGNPLATHLANGVNLLFPIGERFFVRSVRRYLDRVDDPALEERARGFFGQEGRHAHAHEEFFAVLEAQGYRLAPFLAWYDREFQRRERRTPPALRLAITVALEHYTAILAEHALGDDLLIGAHPEISRLLHWHAAEEIEHKAVAFDVLQRVNPSYLLRVAGLVMATLGLFGFWQAATRMLLRQDGVSGRELRRALGRMRARPGRRAWALLGGVCDYLRPGFHPSQRDNYHLARRALAEAA